MLMTLLSMLGGGFMRLLPELLRIWNKVNDNSHELAMMDKQIALQNLKAADDRAMLIEQSRASLALGAQQNSSTEFLALLDARKQAAHDQMKQIGVWWVDAANVLVRPLTTYYFLGCYGIYKTAMLFAAFQQHEVWQAILQTYDADDKAILFSVISFWFVDRVIIKKQP